MAGATMGETGAHVYIYIYESTPTPVFEHAACALAVNASAPEIHAQVKWRRIRSTIGD